MEFLDFDFSSTGEHGDYMSWDEFCTSKGIQELVDHYNDTIDQIANQFETCTVVRCESANDVSNTHLTLPTIYSE